MEVEDANRAHEMKQRLQFTWLDSCNGNSFLYQVSEVYLCKNYIAKHYIDNITNFT